MIIFWLILAFLLLVLFLIAPSPKCSRARQYREKAFAHRGLHGSNYGAAENCLKAFSLACKQGYGIELDVRFTKDRRLVVFHDDSLKRLCGMNANVDQLTLDELRSVVIRETGERIPTFDEALLVVNGRVPLLVELKNAPDMDGLSQAVYQRLKTYPGEYIIESFNPKCLRWFRKHAPEVLRGQLTTCEKEVQKSHGFLLSFCLPNLLTNVISRPDFIAYNANVSFLAPVLQRAIFRTPMMAWTVRSEDLLNKVFLRGDGAIFEDFRPKT